MAPQRTSFILTPTKTNFYTSNDLFSLIDRKYSFDLAPISKVNVGAAGLGSSGKVYLGINVELRGLPLHHSIHAVQFLVANLALNFEPHLTHLAVSAKDSVFDAPCGHCRQFLQEICEASTIKILRMSGEIPYEYVTLKSLLPHPEVLVPKEGGYLLDARDNELTLLYPYAGPDEDPELKSTALAAAKKSFAPYSKCPSGVALKDREKNVYRGWYIESTAFNPSLGPVQAALVDFVMWRGPKFDELVEAVLVEKEDAVVGQEQTAIMILDTIAPNCNFSVFYCHNEPVEP